MTTSTVLLKQLFQRVGVIYRKAVHYILHQRLCQICRYCCHRIPQICNASRVDEVELCRVIPETTSSEEDIALKTYNCDLGLIEEQLTNKFFVVRISDKCNFFVAAEMSPCLVNTKWSKNRRVAINKAHNTIVMYLKPGLTCSFNSKAFSPQIGGLDVQITGILMLLNTNLSTRNVLVDDINIPKGCLIHGKNGSGKTTLVEVVAKKLSWNTCYVSCKKLSTEKKEEILKVIHAAFKFSHKSEPCLIIFDDLNYICKLDKMITQEMIHQLSELDMANKVRFLLTTEDPGLLENELVNTNISGRKVELGIPNEDGREQILKILLTSVKKDDTIDLQPLVEESKSFYGNDLRIIIYEAGILAASANQCFVTQENLLAGLAIAREDVQRRQRSGTSKQITVSDI